MSASRSPNATALRARARRRRFWAIVIAAASLMITLGILGGSVAGQFSVMLGRAAGVSDAMGRIIGAVVFGMGAALTVPVAHAILDAIGRAVGSF